VHSGGWTTVLKELVDLLISIASQKKPVKVEVNYDGKKFHWVVKLSNVSAVEFSRLEGPIVERPDGRAV
jgi:hypothetical protein